MRVPPPESGAGRKGQWNVEKQDIKNQPEHKLSHVHKTIFKEQKKRESRMGRSVQEERGPVWPGDYVYLRVFKRSCLDPRAKGPYKLIQAKPWAVRVEGSKKESRRMRRTKEPLPPTPERVMVVAGPQGEQMQIGVLPKGRTRGRATQRGEKQRGKKYQRRTPGPESSSTSTGGDSPRAETSPPSAMSCGTQTLNSQGASPLSQGDFWSSFTTPTFHKTMNYWKTFSGERPTSCDWRDRGAAFPTGRQQLPEAEQGQDASRYQYSYAGANWGECEPSSGDEE